jgi:hypothetical protein
MAMSWFRLYHDLPNDRKLRKFSHQQKWAWVVLLCLASESKIRGTILIQDEEDLADYCGFETTQDFLFFVDKLRQKEMIEPVEGGIKIVHWEDRQYQRKSDRPEAVKARVSKHRAKKKELKSKQSNPDETPCNALQTPCNSQIRSDQTQIRTDPEEEKTTEPKKKLSTSFADFDESGRQSSVVNFENQYQTAEPRSPWVDPSGGYLDGFVVFLGKTRFSKADESDRRLKAVDAIRWVESRRASKADKDAMIESWKCYQDSIKIAEKKAESEVVRRIDYGDTSGNKFWMTTYGEVIDIKLSKALQEGKIRALKILSLSQNTEAYRICFLADGKEQIEIIRKDAIKAKEAIA